MAKFYVDNRLVDAHPDQSVLQACLTLGYDLPYFCWHPAMGSVGACRQCAVKQYRDEKDTQGRIVMSCMTPVADGIRISITDLDTVAFRAGQIEGMMQSHPHDCPVCDEGGECHLQDMTVMTGHTYRRYRFNKRTFRNQYLGPFLNHEMNRCIQCYRCVRFYCDYGGGHDFAVKGIRNLVYFGRHKDGVFENEFAGNLAEVCPTGVFTDKTHKRHYTRKWDMRFAPSVCVHCGIGCNTSPGERYGLLRRIVNRYNGEVNEYFLCDRGRFGYEFVNSQKRLREPLVRVDGELRPVSKDAALGRLNDMLKASKAIGIGSPRASLEGNFALRSMVGPKRFFAGIADEEYRLLTVIVEFLRQGPARTPCLREIERSDAVLILGEDVTQVAPRMALTLRQSARQKPLREVETWKIPSWLDYAAREFVQNEHGPFFLASPHSTKLDDLATEIYRAAPSDIARLGYAVAHVIDNAAPEVIGLSDELHSLTEGIARALKDAERPTIVSGPSLHSEPIVRAAATLAWALCHIGKQARLSFTAPEANSMGLNLMEPRKLSEALAVVESGEADIVFILENDLYRRAPRSLIDRLLSAAQHVVVLDSLMNSTTSKAELILPAATFAESEGTMVSNEGRAQRFFRVFPPEGNIQSSWQWIRDAMFWAGWREALAWEHLDDVEVDMARTLPALAGAVDAAPARHFRIADAKIPREPHRYSGRTAIDAAVDVSEPKPPEDQEAPLNFTMEGYSQQPPSPLIPFFWTPGWNSYQAVNKFQEEIAGPLRGSDPGVRLIEQGEGREIYAATPPEAFVPRPNERLLVPIYHIFGSEELSAKAPAVAELAPKPYVALNSGDAARLNLEDGEEVLVSTDAMSLRVPLRFRHELPAGIAGWPVGLAGSEKLSLPAWCKVSKR
jgi:NADH-quinone oxidoreductase subunit G